MSKRIVIIEKKLWAKGFEDWFFIIRGNVKKFKDIFQKYDCWCDFEAKWCICDIFLDKYLKFLNEFERKGCKIDDFIMNNEKKILAFICP